MKDVKRQSMPPNQTQANENKGRNCFPRFSATSVMLIAAIIAVLIGWRIEFLHRSQVEPEATVANQSIVGTWRERPYAGSYTTLEIKPTGEFIKSQSSWSSGYTYSGTYTVLSDNLIEFEVNDVQGHLLDELASNAKQHETFREIEEIVRKHIVGNKYALRAIPDARGDLIIAEEKHQSSIKPVPPRYALDVEFKIEWEEHMERVQK